MSKFLGRRYIGTGGGGETDHGLLQGLGDDDHLLYLITSSVRTTGSPTSGLEKTDFSAGDVFSLINAGSGAALYIRQTGTTTDADAAVDIDNTGNIRRGLSVLTSTPDPLTPLVQFSALDPDFDEAVLSVTHASKDGLAIFADGDAYVSSQVGVGEAITLSNLSYNPVTLGTSGLYIESDMLYFVDSTGEKHTFSDDNLVKISDTDTSSDYLLNKLIAGDNIVISELGNGGYERLVISSTTDPADFPRDGYYPFIEVDELSVGGEGSGTIANTSGWASENSIVRRQYNQFLLGKGTLQLKGLTLRSTIDANLTPEITYTIIKDAILVDDNAPQTILSGGTTIVWNQPTTETETYISGNRKDGEIQFSTEFIDFDNFEIPYADGYYFVVFSGDHTNDTKTVIIERVTIGPSITDITFNYPICSFTGSSQTSIRSGQTFDITVITDVDGYSRAVSVEVEAGGAIQSSVFLSEVPSGSGIWTGTVTARSGQPNGYADITVTSKDALANPTTNTLGDFNTLVLFDNDFPVIESFEEGVDFSYLPNQTCLKYGEYGDAYMTVTDFTEILYSSPTGRLSIENPTLYEEVKRITWDQGTTGIEELTSNNVRIRARKSSNCSESNRYFNINLDDTPPRVTSVRWRRDNIGAYTLASPSLGIGTHGVRFVFDDPLLYLPEIIVQDDNKGTLSAFSGSVPGDTFYATLTITESDTNGCSALQLIHGINCSHKLPLDADPITGTEEEFCVDVLDPKIIRVEIDVDKIDGYWNDGYDGYNVMNDDEDNLDNTTQACELDFSSGVMKITSNDILTRHSENVYVSVEMNAPIEDGDICVFDASPWGASSSFSVPQVQSHLYQEPFITNLGSTRNDDQGRAIGRPSIFHASGGNATVTDAATNSDVKSNIDELSANGVDDIGTYIFFTSSGTTGGVFQVSADSFRSFVIGRRIKIIDNDNVEFRTVIGSEIDGANGTIVCDGGSLAHFTVAQNARAVPLGVTDAEIQAWNSNNGLVSYVNDGAFTHLTLIDFANPEAFSQHLTDDQLTQNNLGTVDVDLFRANFWGSKISVPNTHGGTEANPTGVSDARYVWRSKRIRLTTNPTGVQGTNLRFMVFGFSAGTSYRNVSVTSTSDWDQNANKFNLNNNDSQIEIRISSDDPFCSIPPYTNANWFLTTDYEVSPQSSFKFGRTKDINLVFDPPATDVIDKDIYIEVTLITNSSGKAPQIDMIGLSYLT